MNATKKKADAESLLRLTVEDLRSALYFENNVEVLDFALELAKTGAGYGQGVSARKMIQARINKLKKKEAKA